MIFISKPKIKNPTPKLGVGVPLFLSYFLIGENAYSLFNALTGFASDALID